MKKGFAHDANWKEVLLAVVATLVIVIVAIILAGMTTWLFASRKEVLLAVVVVAIVAMILAGTTNWFIKQIQ